MASEQADPEGRTHCVKNFEKHVFPDCSLTEEEFVATVAMYINPPFQARRPSSSEKINKLTRSEITIPIAYFEVGLRLPLWPEVVQILKYYRTVLGMLTPNAVATMVAYACYLREERIEFSLAVFRKLFSFRAHKEGTTFFMASYLKVRETVNKSHHWTEKFVRVQGPFGSIPYSPLQMDEATYKPPLLGGFESTLYKYFENLSFEVSYLVRNLDSLPPVPPGAGERDVPEHPPFAAPPTTPRAPPTTPRVPAKPAALLIRELTTPVSADPSGKRPREDPDQPSSLKKKKGKSHRSEPRPAPPRLYPPVPSVAELSDEVRAVSERVGFFPAEHKNFDLGGAVNDEAGEPLLMWNPRRHRASISTLLPSWSEAGPAGADAFCLGFGLYGHRDASAYDEVPVRQLIRDSARAQLRALSLAHIQGRQCHRLDKEVGELSKSLDEGSKEMTRLREQAALNEARIQSLQGGLDAEGAKQLTDRVTELEKELAASQARNRELVKAARPRSPRPPASRVLGSHEYEAEVQKTVAAAARHIFKAFRAMGLLSPAGERVTLEDVVPELFLPVSGSGGGDDDAEGEDDDGEEAEGEDDAGADERSYDSSSAK